MLTVTCVLRSHGSKIYRPDWVYKLKKSLEKNLSIPHKFICLTDVPLECDHIFLDDNSLNWWSKIQLFKPNLFTDETLYFDLDIIIGKSLDEFVVNLRKQEKNFLMWAEPPASNFNSSILYWRGDYSAIYNKYIESPETYHAQYSKGLTLGDQGFIADSVSDIGTVNSLFPEHFVEYTRDCDPMLTDKTGMLICLSKYSKPHKMTHINFIKENWNV